MIGARRMAFPRIEALTFWLLMLAGFVLPSTIFLGGFPTGWTGYAPLDIQANAGDRRLHRLLRAGRHLDGAARAEHARDGRDDARARDDVDAAADLRLGHDLDGDPRCARGAGADRGARRWRCSTAPRRRPSSSRRPAAARTCTRTCSGSSGTRRSTSSRCPGSAIVLEILPVFARKPLWGYRLAVAGLLGVALLSLLRLAAPPVRQRHQRRPAAVLHVLDRADLDPDRASSSSAG